MIDFNNLPAKDKIYYQDESCVIYCADCREIIPQLIGIPDLVATDPPYPEYNEDHGRAWKDIDLQPVLWSLPSVTQFVFWPTLGEVPLPLADNSAIHIWWKRNSQSAYRYERIVERFGQKNCYVFDDRVISSPVTAQFARDTFYNHPTQKPLSLILKLLQIHKERNCVLDPFMGSGTTLVAAKRLGRKAIGIEIEEKYCEIAAKRLAQSVMNLDTPA